MIRQTPHGRFCRRCWRREAGITAGVVDDFGDLVFGEPVVPSDLNVEFEFVSRAQRDKDAECDEAAVAAAQPVAGPKPAEDVVDANFEEFVTERAVAQVVVGHSPRQELTEDLKTLFTHICHAAKDGMRIRVRSLRLCRPTRNRIAVRWWLVLEAGHHRDAFGRGRWHGSFASLLQIMTE